MVGVVDDVAVVSSCGTNLFSRTEEQPQRSDTNTINFTIPITNMNINVFVYMGGNQRVPQHVTHVRVHKSVKIITRDAFNNRRWLVSIEMHDGVEIIEDEAFQDSDLRGIKLTGVRIIGYEAFQYCESLENVEFGDKLESIGGGAFQGCTPLRIVKLHTVRIIGIRAFAECKQLTEVELSEDLEFIGGDAFYDCPRLRRIAIPLKDNLLDDEDDEEDSNGAFAYCDNLSQVDLIGGIHKTVSSLLLDSWKNEMKDEIDIINQVLPYYDDDKTPAIRQWIRSVLQRIEHFKREHYALLKEDMTLLELALWKSSLPNNIDAADRQQARVTCGANIMIPHVLSFLNDDDVFPSLNQSIE